MIRKTACLSILAAAGIALSACNPKPADNVAAEDNSAMAANEIREATEVAEGVPTGGVCDGIAGARCSSDKDFCKHEAGQCGVMDAQGKCTTKPEICPKAETGTKDYNPVCGCDGKTYGNACEADAAGANVDHEGACKPAAG
jgi:hypothetical protein